MSWDQLTQPQATLLSGALTVIAALCGVWLAWRLFSEKVKDLKSALEESNKLVVEHRNSVIVTLADIQTRLSGLDELSRSASVRLGTIQGTVEDLESAATVQDGPPAQEDRQERMRTRWFEIRDRLENLAASARIDGRTRAKYGRIDRRTYASLIDSMEWDGNLSQPNHFRQALGLWLRYRNGRNAPTDVDEALMERLHAEILRQAPEEH